MLVSYNLIILGQGGRSDVVVMVVQRNGWRKAAMRNRERIFRKRRPEQKRKPDKLQDIDVQVIRRLCVLRYPQAEIAAYFGVTQQLVSAICNRSKRVDVPYDPNVDISKFLQRKPMLKREEVLALLGLAPTFGRRI